MVLITRPSRRPRARSVCGAACAALVLVLLQGCTVCQISLRDGNAANTIHSEGVVWGTRYIIVKPDEGQASSAGLQEVVIKDNFFYDLIGVVTLGFLKPREIEYRNVKPHIDPGGDMTQLPQPDSSHHADIPAKPESDG